MPPRLLALWFAVAVLWSPLLAVLFGPPLTLPRWFLVGYSAATFLLTFLTCVLTIRTLRAPRG